MKKSFFTSPFLFLMSVICACSFTNKVLHNDRILVDILAHTIKEIHYGDKYFDDKLSEDAFDSYIKKLDPMKQVFLASDIDKLKVYRDRIDDYMEGAPVALFEESYRMFLSRMEDVKNIYEDVLKKPYNFDLNDSIYVKYEDVGYAKNLTALKERWRKRLKFITLDNLYNKLEERKEKLKKDADATVVSDAQLEKEVREITAKNIRRNHDESVDLGEKYFFSLYINSILEAVDPHNYYFNSIERADFNASITGKFEGIGAELQDSPDGFIIKRVIYGGPVWKQKALEVGDVIQKVAQEGDKEPTDVTFKTLRNAIKLIKGPKDTKVILTVKRLNGNIEEVSIIRGVVEIETTYLKTAVVDIEGKSFAVMHLPKFYADLQNHEGSRNAASDMRKDLRRLRQYNADGIIIDLRGNGGGSLKTVVDIGGMFIPKGPIVQVRSGKKIEILDDLDPGVNWDKPLVILTDKISASASEILAAAMQDYNRAVIIGSHQTYGKGTVQSVIDLNSLLRNPSEDLGALKITIQKFYRINGGSTQIEGVRSDIELPDRYSYMSIGEKQLKNALPWDEVPATDYVPYEKFVFEDVLERSRARVQSSIFFKLTEERVNDIKKENDTKKRSLNLKALIKKVEADKIISKKFDTLKSYRNHLLFKPLPDEKALFLKDTSLSQSRKKWYDNLQKDFYIKEAIDVLKDIVSRKNTEGVAEENQSSK